MNTSEKVSPDDLLHDIQVNDRFDVDAAFERFRKFYESHKDWYEIRVGQDEHDLCRYYAEIFPEDRWKEEVEETIAYMDEEACEMVEKCERKYETRYLAREILETYFYSLHCRITTFLESEGWKSVGYSDDGWSEVFRRE